jgi:hypothetical protein
MTELSEISSQLKMMRDSIAAFTEAANARLDWEKFIERDASGLENAIGQMTRAATELSIAIDQMTERTQLVQKSINLATSLTSNYESVIAQIESSLDMRMNNLTVQMMEKIKHEMQTLNREITVSSKDLSSQLRNVDSNLKFKVGKTAEETRASNALDTQKVLIEVEKLTNSLSDNFFFRLGGKKKDS